MSRSNTLIILNCYLQGNISQWRIVFFIAAGTYFVGNTLFVVFGKTDIQPWNDSQMSGKGLEAEQQQQQKSDFGKGSFCFFYSNLEIKLQRDVIKWSMFALAVSINLDRSNGNTHQALERR